MLGISFLISLIFLSVGMRTGVETNIIFLAIAILLAGGIAGDN